MEDDEHYVDDPNNPQFHHHGGEYAYQGGNSGGDFEGEGFHGEHEGYEASGNCYTIVASFLSSLLCMIMNLMSHHITVATLCRSSHN